MSGNPLHFIVEKLPWFLPSTPFVNRAHHEYIFKESLFTLGAFLGPLEGFSERIGFPNGVRMRFTDKEVIRSVAKL